MINLDESDMNFLETARFDDNEKQWGMTGGFAFLTDITTVKSGREKRNAVLINPKGSWEIGNRGVLDKEWEMIQSFHYATSGRLLGFRFRDWTDYKDLGNGVARRLTEDSLNYQMFKMRKITSADAYRLQKIIKPVGPSFANTPDLGNTIKFFWNDKEVIQSNNEADPFTIKLNDKKGIFSFTPPLLIVDVADGLFTSSSDHNLKIDDGIKFTLNNIDIYANVIEIVSARSFRTSYSQTFTATASRMNPFPTDLSNFRWTGQYDKAVRFDTDSIVPTVELYKTENGTTKTALQLPAIQIIELTSEEDYLNKSDR